MTLLLGISMLLFLSFVTLLSLTRKYSTTSFSKFGYFKVLYNTEWTTLQHQPGEDTFSTLTMSSSATPGARYPHFSGILSTKIMNEQVTDKSSTPQSHDTNLTLRCDSTSSTLYKQFNLRCNYTITVSIVIIILIIGNWHMVLTKWKCILPMYDDLIYLHIYV